MPGEEFFGLVLHQIHGQSSSVTRRRYVTTVCCMHNPFTRASELWTTGSAGGVPQFHTVCSSQEAIHERTQPPARLPGTCATSTAASTAVGEDARELTGHSRRWQLWAAWACMVAISPLQYSFGSAALGLQSDRGWGAVADHVAARPLRGLPGPGGDPRRLGPSSTTGHADPTRRTGWGASRPPVWRHWRTPAATPPSCSATPWSAVSVPDWCTPPASPPRPGGSRTSGSRPSGSSPAASRCGAVPSIALLTIFDSPGGHRLVFDLDRAVSLVLVVLTARRSAARIRRDTGGRPRSTRRRGRSTAS